MKKKLPLRPNVCMLVYNQKFKLFLGKRAGTKKIWQFPQGGVEKRYTLRENVIRELKEELGLKKRHIGKITRLKHRHSYEFKDPPNYARGKWRGQAQTFWLVEFLGKDKDIDLFADKEVELSRWRWCTVKQVKRLAEPRRVRGYRAALKEFELFVSKHS